MVGPPSYQRFTPFLLEDGIRMDETQNWVSSLFGKQCNISAWFSDFASFHPRSDLMTLSLLWRHRRASRALFIFWDNFAIFSSVGGLVFLDLHSQQSYVENCTKNTGAALCKSSAAQFKFFVSIPDHQCRWFESESGFVCLLNIYHFNWHI